MKKIIKILTLCFFITGCSKKMTCTSISKSDELDIMETTHIYHTLNKIEKIETIVKYEIKDDVLAKTFNKNFEEITRKYNDKFINKQETIGEKIYELRVIYNPRKISKEMLLKLNSPLKLRQYTNYLKTQNMRCEEK